MASTRSRDSGYISEPADDKAIADDTRRGGSETIIEVHEEIEPSLERRRKSPPRERSRSYYPGVGMIEPPPRAPPGSFSQQVRFAEPPGPYWESYSRRAVPRPVANAAGTFPPRSEQQYPYGYGLRPQDQAVLVRERVPTYPNPFTPTSSFSESGYSSRPLTAVVDAPRGRHHRQKLQISHVEELPNGTRITHYKAARGDEDDDVESGDESDISEESWEDDLRDDEWDTPVSNHLPFTQNLDNLSYQRSQKLAHDMKKATAYRTEVERRPRAPSIRQRANRPIFSHGRPTTASIPQSSDSPYSIAGSTETTGSSRTDSSGTTISTKSSKNTSLEDDDEVIKIVHRKHETDLADASGKLEQAEEMRYTKVTIDGGDKGAKFEGSISEGAQCWITISETMSEKTSTPKIDIEESLIDLRAVPQESGDELSKTPIVGTKQTGLSSANLPPTLTQPTTTSSMRDKQASVEDDPDDEFQKGRNSIPIKSALGTGKRKSENVLFDIDEADSKDRVQPKRETATFDPYSSEDLEIFNNLIQDVQGSSGSPWQLLSTMRSNSGSKDQSFSSVSGKATEAGRKGDQADVYECIITGCVNSFQRPEELAQHTFEHGLGWKFQSSDTNLAQSMNPPCLEEHATYEGVSRLGDKVFFPSSDNHQSVSGTPSPSMFRSRGSTLSSRRFDSQSYVHDSELSNSENEAPHNESVRQRLSLPQESNLQPEMLPPTKKEPIRWWDLGVKNLVGRWLRLRPAEGAKRIEWVCGCGDALYADFKSTDEERMNEIRGILQAPTSSPPPVQPTFPLQVPSRSLTAPDTRSSSSASSGSRSSELFSSGSFTSTDASSVSSLGEGNRISTFLELCVNTGEHLKTLGEIDLTNARCDGDLFGAIHDRYLQIRGFRAKFWLLKPAGVSFIKFSVEQRHRVGILQKPLAVPPKSEVDSKRWIYDPCPLEDPPIADHLFLHYLQCPERSNKLFWMLRMPRKLQTSLLSGGIASANFGWGIHINEGPDYRVIFYMNLVGVVTSGIFALCWSIWKHDFQGAFGFACWFIAMLNAMIFAFVYKWQVA